MDNKILVFEAKGISVRYFDKEVLKNISIQVYEGEQWALLGDSDSGKNALLQVLYGKLPINNGEVNFNFAVNNEIIAEKFRNSTDLIALLSFKHRYKNRSNTQQFYYQQRYNSFEIEDSISVLKYLTSIKVVRQNPYWTIEKVLSLFGLNHLVDKACIALSNGETRRLMLAVTLLKNPILLLLDHPMVGLDVETRRSFNTIIEQIVASGIQIIMATSPDEIPTSINRIAIFKEGRILEKGDLKTIDIQTIKPTSFYPNNISHLVKDSLSIKAIPTFKTIVGMNNVHVKYGDKVILDNIRWEIKQGERWVLSGHNGAGKSTLLSLITADNPQAYANSIVLFDRKRGSGESIWEIKKNIGFVSPELHQYFATSQSCFQVICSGFFDTIGLFRNVSAEQTANVNKWMDAFQILYLQKVRFSQATVKEQRLCLLARAFLKNPPLLILDEPCQGLDRVEKDLVKNIIDEICKNEKTTLIYVSHYQDDIPECITKYIQLEKGKVKKISSR